MEYTLKLFKGSSLLLETPVSSELEFFKIIYQLQCDVKGKAHAYLWHFGKIIDVVTLGFPPCRVFNSADGKMYSFNEFVAEPLKFAFRDRQKYAYWIKDKITLSIYGF